MTIQEMVDKALIRPERVRSGKWSPSSFGGCYRKQFWNRKDEPKSNPPDARTLRVFAAGQLFHDFIQNIIIKGLCIRCGGSGRDYQKAGVNQELAECQCQRCLGTGKGIGDGWEKEVLIECDDVKGFADLVGENEVTDIKSQHSRSFWWMTKKDFNIREEKYSNWLQVGYYARELGKKFMRLVFVSKDDLCIEEYVQPLDEYWLHELKFELENLRKFWELTVLPPALPRCKPKIDKKTKEVSYWECEYCNWKDKCFEIEKKV
jgi:hypothetical protein